MPKATVGERFPVADEAAVAVLTPVPTERRDFLHAILHGVARVEAREKALAEASERRKATRDALSQAQVVENKMMARVLRGSSQDVQLLVRHPGLWERWLGKLRKRGFFDGVDEGSPQFDERVRKALRAFARSPGVREFDSG